MTRNDQNLVDIRIPMSMIVGIATVENTMFHVLIENTGGIAWTEFLSYNTTSAGVIATYEHIMEKHFSVPGEASIRITIISSEKPNAPTYDTVDALELLFDTNW